MTVRHSRIFLATPSMFFSIVDIDLLNLSIFAAPSSAALTNNRNSVRADLNAAAVSSRARRRILNTYSISFMTVFTPPFYMPLLLIELAAIAATVLLFVLLQHRGSRLTIERLLEALPGLCDLTLVGSVERIRPVNIMFGRDTLRVVNPGDGLIEMPVQVL